MKVEFYCDTGFVGAVHRETVEIPDDYTDDQISGEFKEWLFDQIDSGWEKEDDNENNK